MDEKIEKYLVNEESNELQRKYPVDTHLDDGKSLFAIATTIIKSIGGYQVSKPQISKDGGMKAIISGNGKSHDLIWGAWKSGSQGELWSIGIRNPKGNDWFVKDAKQLTTLLKNLSND